MFFSSICDKFLLEMFIKSQISNLNILTKIPIYILIRWGKIGREGEGKRGEKRGQTFKTKKCSEINYSRFFSLIFLLILLMEQTDRRTYSLKKDT